MRLHWLKRLLKEIQMRTISQSVPTHNGSRYKPYGRAAELVSSTMLLTHEFMSSTYLPTRNGGVLCQKIKTCGV